MNIVISLSIFPYGAFHRLYSCSTCPSLWWYSNVTTCSIFNCLLKFLHHSETKFVPASDTNFWVCQIHQIQPWLFIPGLWPTGSLPIKDWKFTVVMHNAQKIFFINYKKYLHQLPPTPWPAPCKVCLFLWLCVQVL